MWLKLGDQIINLDRVNRVDLRQGQSTVEFHFEGEFSRFGGTNAELIRRFFAEIAQAPRDGLDIIDITPTS